VAWSVDLFRPSLAETMADLLPAMIIYAQVDTIAMHVRDLELQEGIATVVAFDERCIELECASEPRPEALRFKNDS